MTGLLAVSAACVAVVCGVLLRGSSPGHARARLLRVCAGPDPGDEVRAAPPRVATPLVGALGVAVLAGALSGPLAAVPMAVAAWALLRRLEPAAVRRRRRQVEADLPWAADVLAACLAAGAPTDRSLASCGDAVGGPLGSALDRAAASLRLGSTAAHATAPWHGDPALAVLVPLRSVLVRSVDGGTPGAGDVAALADALRSDRRWAAAGAARRAAVRITAPLGLCFLPAFVLIGIVPVVVAGIRSAGW